MTSDQSGFSLLEGLFSLLILSVAAAASIGLSQSIAQQITFTSNKNDQTRVLNDLMLTIQNDPQKFMTNFKPSAGDRIDDSVLPPNNLPLGFGPGIITKATNCYGNGEPNSTPPLANQCIGRFGVAIQPNKDYRGLLVTQVRVRLDTNGSVQDFIFTTPEF
ncbi:MAG: prepilin-type N-terminal cleavage/methylation domain-containing protein [Bdellovibrionales bacterium]|nr:prepilin-type N-terminal cleavage/methylation domain-containing protein [Bdellovibrionales bacterium]